MAELPRRMVMRQYALPDLRYDYGALEPHICGKTMELPTLPGITWCDLASPERVVNVLTKLGLSTSRLTTYTA